jgi:hypothetical protein
MRRFFVVAMLFFSTAAFAQGDSVKTQAQTPKTILNPANLPRSNDHLMLQFGYTTWQGAPDSINTKGFPRTFNAYFMLDLPFKTDPHWSVGIGAGIGTDAIYFDKTTVELTAPTATLVFKDLSDTSHFKNYKLATSYAEVPLELRYASKPDDSRRSVKVALGVKGGFLLEAHTKGKTLQSSADNTINDYKEKLYSKRFLNKTRIAATARLGYGHFTLFTTYQLTPLFKEAQAPTIRPLTIGLTLSGL